MEYPKFFINIESDWKSPFYLNNEVIKIVDIMELVCGIFYIKDGIVRIDNKDIFLSDVAQIFEKMFNINFGDIYKKEIAVIKRKPTKITEFLDSLKVAIIKKSRDNLSYFYSKNVIDKIYYNDMVAIASFYQYFKTKQTYSLGFDRSTGDTGAYRIYEYEKRMNIIITKLDTVIEKLDEIKNNQAVLYSTIIDANNKIDRMNKNVLLASQNMHDDIRNQTELMAYNNERVRKELEYRNTMDSIFTWK